MTALCRDIGAHWPGALAFLFYWLGTWILDAAISISRRSAVGGGRTTPLIVLTCLISPLLGALLIAWWRAAEGHAHPSARGPIAAGILAAVFVCEANLAVIFCEDAGISTFVSGGSKVRFDLFIAGVIFAAIGAVLGTVAAAAVLSLIRISAFLRTRRGS